MISIKWHGTLFRNGHISHIDSYSSSQTLKFGYVVTCFNSYAPQLLTPPYVDHNNRKNQVTLGIVMKNMFFYSPFMWEKQVVEKRNNKKQLTCKHTLLEWSIMILEKFKKKNHQILSLYKGEKLIR
jgi:hypothetical protein